jgi:hypothetical protein
VIIDVAPLGVLPLVESGPNVPTARRPYVEKKRHDAARHFAADIAPRTLLWPHALYIDGSAAGPRRHGWSWQLARETPESAILLKREFIAVIWVV